MSIKTKILGLATVAVLGVGLAVPAFASGDEIHPPKQDWSFAGPFGKFDRAQIQRGLQIYKEVCAACHGLTRIAFRNLSDAGGPELPIDQMKALAAEYSIKDGPNDNGDMFERKGRAADKFPAPFPNEQAARVANGGALPPDLSLIAKARTYSSGFPGFLIDAVLQRAEHGPDYVRAFLLGFEDAPAGFNLPAGSNYNKYFPGNAVGMPNILSDGLVTYSDGSPQTAAQYATDVTAFLMWAAEPKLEDRKRIGLQVMLFLIVFAGLMYFTKKRVWSDVAH